MIRTYKMGVCSTTQPSVEEFFKDNPDKPYSALRSHALEQSPCYPIIGAKPAGRHIMYYCEICHPEFANDPAVANINLSCIEHHCKYKDPDRHKAEIFSRISGLALIPGETG